MDITKQKVQLEIKMQVTVPQALTLKAMFEYWNQLSRVGSSRMVAFYVDGDGNFHPNCEVTTNIDIPELTDEIREKSIAKDQDGNREYDFDAVAWHFNLI